MLHSLNEVWNAYFLIMKADINTTAKSKKIVLLLLSVVLTVHRYSTGTFLENVLFLLLKNILRMTSKSLKSTGLQE